MPVIPLMHFKIDYKPSPDGKRAIFGFRQAPQRRWVWEDKSPGDMPPDQFAEYVVNAVEPIDLQIGTAIAAARLDPKLWRKIADGILERIDEMLLTEYAWTYVSQTELPMKDLMKAARISKKMREEVADKLLEGIGQILLTERAVRSRTIMEVNAMKIAKSEIGLEALKGILGHVITVAVIFGHPEQTVEELLAERAEAEKPPEPLTETEKVEIQEELQREASDTREQDSV